MTTAPAENITLKALPGQHKFLRSSSREVLYSGAFGSGKSRAVATKLAMRATRPGTREGLCRKHLATLKQTTLRTLLEPDGDLGPVLPPGTYLQNKSEKEIRILGGGTIVYFGLDEPSKIASMNLSGCAIDQAEELSEADWTMLRGRCRMKLAALPNQIYAACNPAGPSHFLAVRFGLDGESKRADGCAAITTRSHDNWFLPKPYLDDLGTFTGVYRARFVEGLWVGSEGMVFDRWDRHTFVRHRQGTWSRCIVGQDEGYTNPACMLVVCKDADGRYHVADEWYKTRQLETAVIEQADRWRERYKPSAFVLDPSAAKIREAMRAVSLHGVEANNDVFGGIQAVQKQLVTDSDGTPLLTVEPHCQNLIREFECYEWAGAKDKPRKENDHAMDALRYVIMYLDGGTTLSVRLIGGDSDAAGNDDDEGWVSC